MMSIATLTQRRGKLLRIGGDDNQHPPMTVTMACTVCGEEMQGVQPPDECPVCGAPPEDFEARE